MATLRQWKAADKAAKAKQKIATKATARAVKLQAAADKAALKEASIRAKVNAYGTKR